MIILHSHCDDTGLFLDSFVNIYSNTLHFTSTISAAVYST